MQVTFLGTGSPRELDRANAAVAIRLADDPDSTAAETVLLDTAGGNEILRQLRTARIPLETIHHIVISHQHFDHAAGLGILLLELSRYEGAPISVYAPAAGLEAIRTVVEVQCPRVIGERFGDRLRLIPLEPRQRVPLGGSATLLATEAVHPVPAIGCVVEWRGRRLGYSGDTAPHASAAHEYAGVDLLIHEASGREGPGAEATHRIGHSTGADAGRIAAAAAVKRLVLTHFPPRSAEEHQAVLAEAAAHFSGPISLAADFATFCIQPSAALANR